MTGAVTVVRDVTAPRLSTTRLPIPRKGCANLGSSLAWSRKAGLAAGTSSGCGLVQFYGPDLAPSRALAHPLGPYTGQTPRLAASDEHVAVLWTTPNPQPATLQILTPGGERRLSVSAVRLASGAGGIVLGQYGAVSFLDPATGRTRTVKAPFGGGWDDPIAS